MGFERELRPEGVLFRFSRDDGRKTRDTFPLDSTSAGQVPPAVRALEGLWYEGRLEEVDGGYLLLTDQLYELEPAIRRVFDLPSDTTPTTIELRTTSFAGSDDFQIRPVVRVGGIGIVASKQRVGPFLQLSDGLRLVDPDTALLLREIDVGPGDEVADHLLYIGRIKDLGAKVEAGFDAYLDGQEIEVPEGIAIEAEAVAPDEIRIRPVPVGTNFDFGEGKTKRSYFERHGGKRRRLVLSEEQRLTADRIKSRGKIQGSDVPRFLNNPEAFLPDEIDLDRFSLRVRGLIPRRYNSQPYLELQKEGPSRDWFQTSIQIDVLDAAPSSGEPSPSDGSRERTDRDARSVSLAAGSTPKLTPDEYAELCRKVVKSGESYVLHKGDWIEIEPDTARKYLEAWEQMEPGERGKRRLSRATAGLVLDVISNVEVLEYEEAQPGVMDPLLAQLPTYPSPALFKGRLRSYQEVGYYWLRYLHENGYGGLLADDMGLGKTVQVIALLAYLAEHDALAPALLVVPAALMDNWHEEIQQFCPSIRYIYHHRGPEREKQPSKLQMCQVVLTTYATLRRDQLELGQVDWSVVACDEAQNVKNPTAQRTSAVKGMKADIRLALTGTPVENGLSELWCIVDFAQPGKLGSRKEFKEEFERPIQAGIEDHAQRKQLAARLQERLTPHYMRRVKEDVLADLPEKRPNRRLHVPLSESQRCYYAQIRDAVRSGAVIPLVALQNLIQVCSHPDLYTDRTGSPEELIARCPKLERTLAIVEEIRERDEKVLVYTRYRHMQWILQEALQHQFGIHAPTLNGEVRTGQRHHQVQRFNCEPGFGAMILSPEAAGVGLNIVGANHVVHYTRLWNPAKESQATDRVYRIGQKRPVQVYYPIVVGEGFKSVEEHLDELLEQKRTLAKDVVWPREKLSVEADMQAWLEESV